MNPLAIQSRPWVLDLLSRVDKAASPQAMAVAEATTLPRGRAPEPIRGRQPR